MTKRQYTVTCYLPDGSIADSFAYDVEFATNALNRVKKQWTIACLSECTAIVENQQGMQLFSAKKINGRWRKIEDMRK